jgi:2-haloacid dehalogenase
MTDLDYGRFDALTFDCYGTLIDWEAGILAGLRQTLGPRGIEPPDDELLEIFAGIEATAEAGPYVTYREILGRCLREIGASYGVSPDDAEAAAFGGSVVDWPAFADSATALQRLHTRFRLGVLTNCDDDLFAGSAARLGIDFDWVVTAQQVGSYKPNERNFRAAFERLGIPRDRILHVAQSLFHDHAPARRPSRPSGSSRHGRNGVRCHASSKAVPGATFPDMASFAVLPPPDGEGSGLRAPGDDDRDGRGPNDLLRHAAHDEAVHAAAPVRTHDDQIDGLGGGGFDDRLTRIALPDETADRHVLAVATLDDPLGGGFTRRPDLVHPLMVPTAGQPQTARIDHANEQHRTAETARQLEREVLGTRRGGRQVARQKDRLDPTGASRSGGSRDLVPWAKPGSGGARRKGLPAPSRRPTGVSGW